MNRSHVTFGISARRSFMALLVWALVAVITFTAIPNATADNSTSGDGRFLESIVWAEWGTNREAIPSGGKTVTSSRLIGGSSLDVTCTMTNPAGGTIIAYRSGDWRGDSLDNLYNVGGADGANTQVIGLRNRDSGDLVTFTVGCSATYGGVNLPLQGLVFADAESSEADPIEYVEATAAVSTWRVIDRVIEAACTETGHATLFGSTLRLGATGQCSDNAGGYGPAAVAFMEGATSANVAVQGSGYSAVAVGAVIQSDLGDAPASYGSAGALMQPTWTGGTLAAGTTDLFAGFTLGDQVTAMPRLGALVDAEIVESLVDATSDDSLTSDDEDAIASPLSISASPGATYTLAGVPCVGPGSVQGWIDWDGSGTFDADEGADTPICAGGTVDLAFLVPADAVAGTSYMRLRIATNPAEVASPTGVSLTGEVEDHEVSIVVNPCVPSPYASPGDQPANGTAADCDGDGALNADDTDPGDPCLAPGDIGWVAQATQRL